jgi:hypothetical protein
MAIGMRLLLGARPPAKPARDASGRKSRLLGAPVLKRIDIS